MADFLFGKPSGERGSPRPHSVAKLAANYWNIFIHMQLSEDQTAGVARAFQFGSKLIMTTTTFFFFSGVCLGKWKLIPRGLSVNRNPN